MFIPLAEFVEIVNEVLFLSDFEDLRVTKSGFSLTNCYFTGIYVDMSKNYQSDVDLIKGQLIEDPNFKCYCAFAQEHGFLVDASSPWRLVVDLEADVTRRTILNGRPMEQFDNFFSDVYTMKVGYDDYWEIEIFYQFLYNEYVNKLNERGVQTPTLINYPSEVSLSPARAINRSTNSHLWLKCLIVNKLREFKIIRSYDEFSDFDEIYQNCIDILNNSMVQFRGSRVGILNNPSSPIGFVNREFSKIIENFL